MGAALADALGLPSGTRRGRRWLGASNAVAAAGVLVSLWMRPGPRRDGIEYPVPKPAPAASPSISTPPVSAALPATGPGTTGDPFVAPLGLKGPVSDAAGPPANAAAPFSVRAAWHPQQPVPKLEIRASRPLSVYLVYEEAPSRCFLLFPLPGRGQQNPLAENLTHWLPVATPVSRSPGRLVLVASPSPLIVFEAALARSRVPVRLTDGTGIRLTDQPLNALRALERDGAGTGARRPLFESAPPLAAHTEIVQGAWIRLLAVQM
jgi:hypothetical protein